MKDPNAFVNSYLPTPEDVVKLAMNPRFPHGLAVTTQARIVDMNLTPVPLPFPIDPKDPSALCSPNGTGYVWDIKTEMNKTDDVPTKATFKLLEFPGISAFNTLKTMLHISTQYWFLFPTGPVMVAEVPIGYFLFSIPERTIQDSGNIWDVQGHGRTQIVADLGFENDYTIPLGADLIQAAKTMLMMDYLPPYLGGRSPASSIGQPQRCIGIALPSGTGTGRGYSEQGFGITDPRSGTVPYGSSPLLRQRGADGFLDPVIYNTTIGMKIDPGTGAPIDPWTCEPMIVETVTPDSIDSSVPGSIIPGHMVIGSVGGTGESFPAFITSKVLSDGSRMYLDTVTGKCYDSLTGSEVDPLTLLSGTVATPNLFFATLADSFGSGGGDGGLTVGLGSGAGYSKSYGWSVPDTEHALTVQAAPGSQYYLHWVPEAGRNVQYLYVEGQTGVKVEAVTGHPIDPWNQQPMPLGALPGGTFPDPTWAGDLFLASQDMAGDKMWFDPSSAGFYTWDGIDSAGHLTQVFPAHNGVVPTYPMTVFVQAGGDGGISTLPPGAVGPQAGPVGSYQWPDSNNPALTPAGCPTSGPNVPAHEIIDIRGLVLILDPSTGQRIASEPVATDTIPFTPKDNMLKAQNTLLSTAQYWPLCDDAYGNFIYQQLPYTDGTTPRPDPYFFYRTGPDGVMANGMKQQLLDATSMANKVVVRSENTKRAAITAVAYNVSKGSYLSVHNLKRVIQKQPVIQLDTITDRALLKLRADIEVNLAALPAESIQVDTFLNPFLDVHDVIGMNVYSPDGKTLEVSTHDNPFLVTSYKHDFAARRTSMTLGRLVPV